MLQNATPLRKSAPWLSHACHRFGNCYKTLTFCSLLTRCTIPCACHAKRHLNVKKWSEHVVSLTFWLRNVLRATTACTFSTSQLPKVVRTWCVLYILTSKCASRHNGVHFFDIATSKSGPNLVCFVHFDFDMCFTPQRRALFRHLNFQKWSEHGVFCRFWLRNVLRATTACNFSSLIWPQWLRTRRFSEPSFRPSGATNHWKNRVFRDFPTFSRACIFFLLTLSLLWSSVFCSSLFYSSLLSDSSHLCFSSVHIVGSLTSKLPSVNHGHDSRKRSFQCSNRIAYWGDVGNGRSNWVDFQWPFSAILEQVAVGSGLCYPRYPVIKPGNWSAAVARIIEQN